MNEPVVNTDRELWRQKEGDFYSPSINVTASGGIGINVGGNVIVKSVGEWHTLALNERVGGNVIVKSVGEWHTLALNERQTLLNAVLELIKNDPHGWSSRPCQTCRAVSSIVGRPFGCSELVREDRL